MAETTVAKTFRKNSISIEFAERLIAKVAEEAAKLDRRPVVCVIDEGGNLKSYRRPDHSFLTGATLAITKARSAVGLETPTHELYSNIQDDPQSLHSIPVVEGFTILGGGYPIVVDSELIGGIGVSGSQSWQENVQFISAAFQALGVEIDVKGWQGETTAE